MRRSRRHFRTVLLLCLLLSTLGATLPGLGGPSYEIDLDVAWDTGTFAGTLRVTTENATSAPLDELVFRLFPNDAAIYGEAWLEVLGVSAGGTPLSIRAQSNSTVLPAILPSPLEPGQTTSLVLQFHGQAGGSPETVTDGSTGYGILTRNDRSFVLTAFYPILAVVDDTGWRIGETCGLGDALWAESSDYDVTVSTSPAAAPAATGRLLSSVSEEGAGLAIHRFRATAVRDFALVLTQGYAQAELQTGSHTLRSWFSPTEEAATERTLTIASQSVSVFERRIGPLAYEEIDLVGVPLHRAAGVEFSGLILLSSARARNPSETFYEILVSHEMAHQWFYASVGNDPTLHPWLDEGPATYLSNLYLEEAGDPAAAAFEVRDWQQTYGRIRHSHAHLSIGEPTCRFARSTAYGAYAYSGGAWFLHSIRQVIGDDAFFEGLSSYYAMFFERIATPSDLFDAFDLAAGYPLHDVYETFGFVRD